jgi:5-dehydro-4-deoxyglucarate dehydratase
VCKATSIGIIVYNRDNAILNEDSLAKLCERNPNLVGFKDGVGDIELMMRVYARMGDRLTYIGGLPTAETFALPYLEMGVTTYSSAIFNFLPKFAQEFYAAVRRRDHEMVYAGLRDFVLPYIGIRNRRKGYAVSIVKAGMTAIGRPAGPVRLPLLDLGDAELAELTKLIGDRS